METPNQDAPKASGASSKKATPKKLPSKQITFGNQGTSKSGGQGKVTVNKSKKGGVNLMRKLSGM